MKPFLFSILILFLISLQPISPIDLLYNGFHSFDLSLYGIARIESKVLTLTNRTNFAIGRALYPYKVPTKDPKTSDVIPFSTSFVFSMAPFKDTLPGHGIVFLFVPYTGIKSANSAQNLGFLNRTNTGNSSNHVFGVEFDVFKNEEFGDINANHVGIDVNSLNSVSARGAGYYRGDDEASFKELKLNNGKNYQVWIDYDGFVINVTMVIAGMKRPNKPLLSVPINLSLVFEDEMYVGFTASTGQLVEGHRILCWSFSNSNFSLHKALVTSGLPSFELPKDSIFKSKGFIAGITLGIFFVVLACVVFVSIWVRRKRKKEREREEMEDWEFEYWPHRMDYKEIEVATNGFAEENVIGIGGNGKVYKGVMQGGVEVAVKRISHDANEGTREFLAEVSSIGRLKHRNLVGLRGWCKKEKGSFILLYDYMENGSLDRRIYYDCDEEKKLGFEDRIRILKDVAIGVLYLHEGWESKVLHRDIKASNVLLDKEMNAKLGDFGLARIHNHSQVATTTKVVGTVGYMAPEVVRTGRASDRTDVFGFGILILEVLCGRRPIEENKPPLVEWLWELMSKGELSMALDEKLRLENEINEEEIEKLLHLGLLCSYPDPGSRPNMRQVVKILEGRGTEGDESDTEDMTVNLLERMRSKEMWDKYMNSSQRNSSHPTFEQMRNSISSSMSLSWSDTIVVGR